MKQMNLDSSIPVKDPLGDFHFPGWYRDVEGALCLVIKEHLISVSYNEAAKEYNVCVNVLGSRGLFDENVLWESFGAGIPAKQCALSAVQRVHNDTL